MEEIAVELSTHNIAQNVNVLSHTIQIIQAVLSEAAIKVCGLVMGIVTIPLIIKSATTMVEIAVETMSIHNTAQIVNALKPQAAI